MKVYGYVRKDYPTDTLTQLEVVMPYKCAEIYIEANRLTNDKELAQLLERIEKGDRLIIYSLEAFGKNHKDMAKILNRLKEKTIQLIILADQIDTDKDQGFYDLYHLFITNELGHKRKRIEESLDSSRAKGITIGRPSIEHETIVKIQKLHQEKSLSLRMIAAQCDVSVGTVHKYVNSKAQSASAI